MTVSRTAGVYADFVAPHLTSNCRLVDVGCGSGELSLELAAMVGQLLGVDADRAAVSEARTRATSLGVSNADFRVGNIYSLDLPDGHADVVFGHSVLEALDRPDEALVEMKRVLGPGGVVAVASVDYGGLILAGPHEPLLRRFYAIREKLWQVEGANPYLGRNLRGLLDGAGFISVEASTTYVCYGTRETVHDFGVGRADDCLDAWYTTAAMQEGLATSDDLEAMRLAWLDWSRSPTSYAAFAWCRAVGHRT